jgi:hypothetical protein
LSSERVTESAMEKAKQLELETEKELGSEKVTELAMEKAKRLELETEKELARRG